MVAQLLTGGVVVASLLASLFFLRFWAQSRDTFFLLFAGSFALDACVRLGLALIPYASEDEPLFYMVRLVAYGLILVAIWQKNRTPR